jgi:DNA-binding transcriptional MerR regulator
MVLARTALQWPYPGGKEPVRRLVKSAAGGDFGTAMESAYKFLANVKAEQAQADTAAAFLEQWAMGQTLDTINNTPLLIGTAAKRLDVTADMLRNWERNGLLQVPRHPTNGYRLYGAAELGRARVIRVLRQAGYSVMAILRMMLEFDAGRDDDASSLRQALDTPRPDEDVYNVTDRWLTTLAETEKRAQDVIQLLTGMIG